MKKIFVKPFDSVPRLFLQITVACFLIIYLTGCSCKQWCGMWLGGSSCEETCEQKGISTEKGTTNVRSEINTTDRATDSVASVGNPVPQKKAPGQIEGPFPGEVFSNTISFGPALSFKSSNEEYGGGYGKHEPGIGFNIGVGTVLPFNKHWAIAPALRFTQKNASEKLSYPGGPGGGNMEFTDKYSYNYLGGTMLGQYRAGKHISLVAGPEVNYLVSASVKNGGSSGTGEKQNIAKSSQKVGIDLLAGIKLEIPAKSGRSKWGLQLMYDHRLSRLNKKKDDTGQDIPAYNMKGVQLGLAYNICGSCGKKK
jgi:hypothetical protein